MPVVTRPMRRLQVERYRSHRQSSGVRPWIVTVERAKRKQLEDRSRLECSPGLFGNRKPPTAQNQGILPFSTASKAVCFALHDCSIGWFFKWFLIPKVMAVFF